MFVFAMFINSKIRVLLKNIGNRILNVPQIRN